MSALALDLRHTAGYLVADARGRIVGRVECPMYGTSPEEPDALSVRSGFLARRRRLVPADSIEVLPGRHVCPLRRAAGPPGPHPAPPPRRRPPPPTPTSPRARPPGPP